MNIHGFSARNLDCIFFIRRRGCPNPYMPFFFVNNSDPATQHPEIQFIQFFKYDGYGWIEVISFMHSHSLASYSFQSSFDLCFFCLRFGLLQIEETGICLVKDLCESFEYVMVFFRERSFRITGEMDGCIFCKSNRSVSYTHLTLPTSDL